jgi:hypothetical protein
MYGGSLKSIVLDAMDKIPNYKSYFIGIFTQKPRKYSMEFNFSNPHIKTLREKEPEYFKVLYDFYIDRIYPLWKDGTIPTDIYNQIMSLSTFIADIASYLNENESDIVQFKVSHKFLKHFSSKEKIKVPMVFYPHLAFLLIVDEIDYKIDKMKPTEREKYIVQYDPLKEVAIASFMFLKKYSVIIERDMKDFFFKETARDQDVYFNKQGKARPILFFNPEPQCVIVLGNRGTGKTIATIRVIMSALIQGFTVIVFADPRGEFRFVAHPLKSRDDKYMWDKMKAQGINPKGLPITFYTERPSHDKDKDISDFEGTDKDWESLSGIVVFRGTKIAIDVEEGVGRNVRLKHVNHVARVMKSFEIWREQKQEKKVLIALNEAQEFIGSEADRTEWELYHAGTRLVTNVRGYNCPILLNTQFLSRLKTPARQFDILFTSMITLDKERKLIANIFGRNEIKNFLAPTKDGSFLMEKHIFYKFEKGRYEQVKFLAVPCMTRGSLPS